MKEALTLAGESAQRGEVPVGAVVVIGGEVAGAGSNAPIARRTRRPTPRFWRCARRPRAWATTG